MKQKTILPSLVVPLLLLITAALVWVALDLAWNLEITSYLIFLFTAGYLSFFERIIPLKPAWNIQKSSLIADLKHVILSAAIFDALGKMAALSLVLFLQKQFFPTADIWNGVPFLLLFLLANVIGEFLPYLYHRLSHIGRENSRLSLFLWKTHAIHHIPITMNWLKTTWIHPINMFLNTALKLIPLLLLGFGTEILFAVGVTHIVIAYVSHANIQTRTGWLDYVVVTPHIHHFHHSTDLHEAKNFGNILPFWDLVFGTYYKRKGAVAEVGVVAASYAYPKLERYLQQLVFPFRGCCGGRA